MPPPVSATLWTKTIALPSGENEASWSSSGVLVSARGAPPLTPTV